MRTVYAKQVPPQYQESPLFMDEEFFPDNIAVFGNNYFQKHIPKIVENVLNILENGELCDILNNIKQWGDWYKNVTEAITEYLPPENGKRYSTNTIHILRNLISDYSLCDSSQESDILCQVLSIVTGKIWDCKTIRGYCQSDWNMIYFPVDEWNDKDLNHFETAYFNAGTEWIVYDGEEELNNPDSIDGFCMYCIGKDNDEIKAEIKSETGADDVVLFAFTGFSEIAQYEKI